MLSKLVERVGDAGLESLERVSSRRKLLGKSIAILGAGAGIALSTKDVSAAYTYKCMAGSGCGIRPGPSSSGGYFVACGTNITCEGGAWGTYYPYCRGWGGDYQYYWRWSTSHGGYVHSNVLADGAGWGCC